MKFSGRMHGVIEAEKKCMLTCVGLGSDCFIADFAGKEDIAVGRLRIGCSTAGQGVDPLQGQGGLGGRHSCGRYSRRRLPIKQQSAQCGGAYCRSGSRTSSHHASVGTADPSNTTIWGVGVQTDKHADAWQFFKSQLLYTA